MNYYSLVLFSSFLISSLSSYVKHSLSVKSSNYFITLYLGESKNKIQLSVDTSIAKSLIASPKCKVCRDDKYEPSSSSLVSTNATLTKQMRTFNGDLYIDSVVYDDKNESIPFPFISFVNVTYVNTVNTIGFFALSFTNENIKSVIGVEFLAESGRIDIGDSINTDYITNQSKLLSFPVTIEKDHWYLLAESFSIDSTNFELEAKFTLDSTSWTLDIPSKFFFDNIETIFPHTNQCQVQLNGAFVCRCTMNYKNEFPTFTFNISDTPFKVYLTDYIDSDTFLGGNKCYVYITVNYDSDLWTAGLSVMNNYYNVFDYVNHKYMIYPKTGSTDNKNNFIVTFFVVFALSSLVFYGAYYLYKKCCNNWQHEDELFEVRSDDEEEGQ